MDSLGTFSRSLNSRPLGCFMASWDGLDTLDRFWCSGSCPSRGSLCFSGGFKRSLRRSSRRRVRFTRRWIWTLLSSSGLNYFLYSPFSSIYKQWYMINAFVERLSDFWCPSVRQKTFHPNFKCNNLVKHLPSDIVGRHIVRCNSFLVERLMGTFERNSWWKNWMGVNTFFFFFLIK